MLKRSPLLPDDIPKYPQNVYKDKGWKGFKDWLGIEVWMSFESARRFVHSLELKSLEEWNTYCLGAFLGRLPFKPNTIPKNPNIVYKKKGWVDWGDWLGCFISKGYVDYESSRAFVHTLGLESVTEWRNYCKGYFLGRLPFKPSMIPSSPDSAFKNKGWRGWRNWLGTKTRKGKGRTYRDYASARDFARSLGLKSYKEWVLYCRGNRPDLPELPDDIPAGGDRIYKGKGWISWPDWLGKD